MEKDKKKQVESFELRIEQVEWIKLREWYMTVYCVLNVSDLACTVNAL